MRINVRRVSRHRRVVEVIAPRLNREPALCRCRVAELRAVVHVRIVPRVHRLVDRVRPRRSVPVDVVASAKSRLVQDAQRLVSLRVVQVPCVVAVSETERRPVRLKSAVYLRRDSVCVRRHRVVVIDRRPSIRAVDARVVVGVAELAIVNLVGSSAAPGRERPGRAVLAEAVVADDNALPDACLAAGRQVHAAVHVVVLDEQPVRPAEARGCLEQAVAHVGVRARPEVDEPLVARDGVVLDAVIHDAPVLNEYADCREAMQPVKVTMVNPNRVSAAVNRDCPVIHRAGSLPDECDACDSLPAVTAGRRVDVNDVIVTVGDVVLNNGVLDSRAIHGVCSCVALERDRFSQVNLCRPRKRSARQRDRVAV